MATILNRTQTFATNGTVTAAGLHNLIDDTGIYAGLITTQTELTTVGTADQILIAVGGVSDTGAPRRATVQNLFDDALSVGTYTGLNLSGALTYGTATGNRTVSTSATITTGTITNLTSSTANITLGTIPTLTAGTTTSTAANITNGTVQTLTASTGTIGTFNSTTGTIATLNSTTGTIGNLSTTLAGDFTISQGTATLATSGATAGTYGSVTAIPFITVDAKGRITSATTGTFSSTPADGSITPAKLSQPFTSATAVASTSGTAIDFTSIPSWVKRITVMFDQVSTNGASLPAIQLGDSGGVETSGYNAASSLISPSGISTSLYTASFTIRTDAVSGVAISGHATLNLLSSSANTWAIGGILATPTPTAYMTLVGGTKSLSATLDRVRITTVNGTDTFDAGSVNILYEG
ncbi:MAG: hypothetical protein EBZ61_10355 [Micrococcales bacterium]|nr:hypothetical protein [Micrococcales bacterium]